MFLHKKSQWTGHQLYKFFTSHCAVSYQMPQTAKWINILCHGFHKHAIIK
jgi:hypothetical protein